jgi:hypothetical protein
MNGCILLNSNGIVSHRNSRNHGCILHSPSRYGTSRHGQGTLAATSIFLRRFPFSPTFIIWFLDHAFVVNAIFECWTVHVGCAPVGTITFGGKEELEFEALAGAWVNYTSAGTTLQRALHYYEGSFPFDC